MKSSKYIYPDQNSWISDVVVSFLKDFKNEFSLTLWEAIKEYVSFHNPHCAYLGESYEGELFLYPLLDYNPDARKATLKKLFFVSKQAKKILSYNYLSNSSWNPNNSPIFNILNQKDSDRVTDFPEIEFMVAQNNIEPSLAKEILLKTSYLREETKKYFIFENEAMGIEYESINITKIDLDLTLLRDSKFLEVPRYSSFKDLLPSNFIVTISCKLEFDLPRVPKKLKQTQLLDVSSIEN